MPKLVLDVGYDIDDMSGELTILSKKALNNKALLSEYSADNLSVIMVLPLVASVKPSSMRRIRA